MYNFIDTTEVSESIVLPSEALQINGEYIENLIDGYRTVSVSGREALSPELSYYETGVRDGSTLQSKRYPARIIIVCYQLVAESSEAFRESYNKLGGILNVEDAKLIFNDEPDKFYIGTPCAIGEVEPGRNAVVGEIEILCTDPFKYSVEEHEAVATSGSSSVVINYNGTYKSFPTLEADFYDEAENGETETTLTGNGDCGFVAFYDENKNIVQLGDPAEIDGEKKPSSQTLINQTFLSNTAWGTTAKKLWILNSGKLIPSTVSQLGAVGMRKSGNDYYLSPTSYGTASGWHGVSITRQLGADATGEVGATHFHYYGEFFLSVTHPNEMGAFQTQVYDGAGNNIAGFRITKTKTGKTGKLNLYVKGEVVESVDIDLPYQLRKRAFYIRKNGANIQFNINSFMRHFTVSDLATVKASKVTFSFEKYASTGAISTIGVQRAKFTKLNCNTWKDVPNKFGASDVLVADCKSGEIFLNGIEEPSLGALGNDWEEFCLTPGANQIGFAYSDWLTEQYAPTIKVKYREVFL